MPLDRFALSISQGITLQDFLIKTTTSSTDDYPARYNTRQHTFWTIRHFLYIWLLQTLLSGSCLRSLGLRANAERTGLEPVTCCLTDSCSNQLSYLTFLTTLQRHRLETLEGLANIVFPISQRTIVYSCGGRTRTADLLIMSQLSYHCSTPRFIGHVL